MTAATAILVSVVCGSSWTSSGAPPPTRLDLLPRDDLLITRGGTDPAAQAGTDPLRGVRGPDWAIREVMINGVFGSVAGAAAGGLGGYLALTPWRAQELSPFAYLLPAGLAWLGLVAGATVPIMWIGSTHGGRGSLLRTLAGAALGALLLPPLIGAMYVGVLVAGLPLTIVAGIFAVLSIAAPVSLGAEAYVKSHKEAVAAQRTALSFRF